MFKDAQKDKVAASVYKEVHALKGDFDKLITAIQEKNKLKTQIADVQLQLEDFRIKYKGMEEINKLKAELQDVMNENARLQQSQQQYYQ